MKLIEEAYKQNGLERAKSLIALIKSTPRGADPSLSAEHLEELAKLDPGDSLGFRKDHLAETGFTDLDRAIKEVFHKDSYDTAFLHLSSIYTRMTSFLSGNPERQNFLL